MIKAAVIAGTPVDTRMGVEYLEKRSAEYCTPVVMPLYMLEDFFIYCNSLSGAFDFDAYAEEKGVKVYTPLQVYRKLGQKYGRVGLVAAHNLSAYKIEETLLEANPDMYVIGSGNMAIVSAIEHGLPAEEIVEKCGVKHMVKYMETCGCEALILGCTHFPYLRRELDKFCIIPVIDPADEMFAAMTGLK